MTRITIVVPVYNEQGNLRALHAGLNDALKDGEADWRVLFVDDGSTDESLDVIRLLAHEDPGVGCITLTRNFGHQVAIAAGIDHAGNDAVLLMDADLQHPPEVVPSLIQKWRDGYEIVSACRQRTEDASWAKRTLSRWFYRLLNAISSVPIVADAPDFVLYAPQVVASLRRLRERHRFNRGLTGWVGYRRCLIEFTAPARFQGETKYTFRRMLRFASDGLISFSVVPLRLSLVTGAIISVASFVYAAYGILAHSLYGKTIPGWTSILVSVLFLGGAQLVSLGIIGEYVGRTYEESKRRPLYLVHETYGFVEGIRPQRGSNRPPEKVVPGSSR